jgi:hypothetical protein
MGISPYELARWAVSVRKRDKGKCRMCKKDCCSKGQAHKWLNEASELEKAL